MPTTPPSARPQTGSTDPGPGRARRPAAPFPTPPLREHLGDARPRHVLHELGPIFHGLAVRLLEERGLFCPKLGAVPRWTIRLPSDNLLDKVQPFIVGERDSHARGGRGSRKGYHDWGQCEQWSARFVVSLKTAMPRCESRTF